MGEPHAYGGACAPAFHWGDDRMTEITREMLLDLHQRMVRIRIFEEEAGRLSEAGRIPGALHLLSLIHI